MKNIKPNLKNLFMHIIMSIFRAHLKKAGFGANWSWLNKNHEKKIQKISCKIKSWNHWIQEILWKFVNLKWSLHIQECKPNALGLLAALRSKRQHLKNCLKTQKLFSRLQVDSGRETDLNSFLGISWTYSNP